MLTLEPDSDGEGQWERKKMSVQQLWWARDYAKEKQIFCYTWTRNTPEGTERFLVLSEEPPPFEPSLQYEILHDPTA